MTLLVGYLVGFGCCAVGALVVAQRSSPETRPSVPVRLTFATLIGILWPVVVVGGVQAVLIAALLTRYAAYRRRREMLQADHDASSSGPAPGREPWDRSLGCRRLVDHMAEPVRGEPLSVDQGVQYRHG